MNKPSIKHYYQPTNHSCSQASMASALSFYGINHTPEEIAKMIPVNKDDDGKEWGTINQQLATWCIGQGFDVVMYTADFEVIDLSWVNLSKTEQLERMEATKEHRDVPGLGKEWSKMYMQAYIDFINAGGELHIVPFMTRKIINTLLADGPIIVCVCSSVLYNSGRSKNIGLRKSVNDDINGIIVNHTIVVFDKDKNNNYIVSDPWKEPGIYAVEPEQLLAAMAAAQIECDNLIFQLKKRSS